MEIYFRNIHNKVYGIKAYGIVPPLPHTLIPFSKKTDSFYPGIKQYGV